jgi:hypothetical protein
VASYEDLLLVKVLKEGPWDRGMSLSWPAGAGNENSMVRMQNRRTAVEQARKDRVNGSSDWAQDSEPPESSPSDSTDLESQPSESELYLIEWEPSDSLGLELEMEELENEAEYLMREMEKDLEVGKVTGLD